MSMSTCLYTKDQLQQIMSAWGCTEPVPKKGQQVVVCWPKPVEPNTAIIKWSDKVSGYGDRLYSVVMGMSDEVLG